MNFGKILFTLAACSLSLSACTTTPVTPTKSKLVGDVIDYLESRNVTIETIPYIEYIDDAKVLDTDTFEGDDLYVPYFYFLLEGDVVDQTLEAFKKANWTVPATPDEDYGYECVDPDQKVEIDLYYSDVEDEGSGIGTNYYVYAYADLSNNGDDSGDDLGDLDDPAAEAVALVIATSIYGADAAEDNVSWFFIYYVENTINGTDLRVAIQDATQHIPAGFAQDGEISIETETDEETGESYELASAIFYNDDNVYIYLETTLSSEEGKIDVIYLVYSDDGSGADSDDDLPGDQEGDTNVVINADGSKTVTVDFTGFADKATYSGQTIGDLTITAFKDAGTNDTTYYQSGESLRIYWGTGLKFSVPQGNELVKIEFTCTTGNNKTVDVDESNLTITGGSYTVNEKDVIITANQGVNELSMLINLDRGNVAITGISVTYK